MQVYRLLEEREALRASAHPLVWGDDDVTPPVVPALEGDVGARFEACCAELVDLMGGTDGFVMMGVSTVGCLLR